MYMGQNAWLFAVVQVEEWSGIIERCLNLYYLTYRNTDLKTTNNNVATLSQKKKMVGKYVLTLYQRVS